MRDKAKQHKVVSIILGVSVLAVLAVMLTGLFFNPSIVKSTQIGKEAQPFEVEILSGASWIPVSTNNKVQLKDLKGYTVILNFWASWCVSCREEAAEMERFWTHQKDKKILVLGIAIQDTPEAALEFAKAHGKTYPLAIDSTGRTGIDYGVYGVPETFIIDGNGKILFKESGPVTAQYLETTLSSLKI
jgi:cytochrome c biogenesis protein CcmG/thiol:disulfide interchange protein DsbE